MLKLIQTEFLKLRRRKFFSFMLLTALFMPFLAVFYFRDVRETGIEAIQFYKWTAYSYTPWIILPVVLGVVSTMLMYDENLNDTLKQLWIVPISKTGYFFSKFIIVFFYSICFMMLTAAASVLFGMLPGYITLEWNSISYMLRKCMEIAILTAFAIIPLLGIAPVGKGYILPICVTLVYPGVVLMQAFDIPAAFLCIAIWGACSVLLAVLILRKRE